MIRHSLFLFCFCAVLSGAEARWQRWDGSMGSGALRIVDGNWRLDNEALDAAQIFEVHLIHAEQDHGGRRDDRTAIVLLRDGARLVGELSDLPSFANLTLNRGGGRDATTLTLPGAAVRAVELHALQSGALIGPRPQEPYSILTNGRVVPGEAEWLTSFDLGIRGPAGRMRLSRERLHRIVLTSDSPREPGSPGDMVLRSTAGDVVAGHIQTLDAEQVVIVLTDDLGTVRFPRSEVLSLSRRSERIRSLCDLAPDAVETTPWLDFVREPVVDGSLFGGPLVLDELPLLRGIAMHARSLFRWQLDGTWQRLRCTIGLDRTLSDRGEAVFVVRGDGRELFRQAIQGTEPAQALDLALDGIKVLELELDFGTYGSGGSHGIWGDPRLIR